MPFSRKTYYFLTLLCLCLTGCVSVPKLLEKGNYEQAYFKARKHCTRVRAPKWKKVEQFLDAYAAVQALDQARAEELQRRRDGAKWEPLYALYSSMYERSLDLLTIVPDTEDFKRHPELLPARLEQQREEARKQAGAHYLDLTAPLLGPIREGDKTAARQAYQYHRKMDFFLPERRAEFSLLRDTIIDVATLRILLYVPSGQWDAKLNLATQRLQPIKRGWTEILTQDNGQRMDVEAALYFTNYRASGPSESCSTQSYEEEVLDRIEHKKVEERINDSTVVEKIIEIKHYKKVFAAVTTCDQSAFVYAYGQLAVYLPGKQDAEWERGLSAGETWSNCYRYGEGDARALPAFANSGSPGSPPSEWSMLADAVVDLPWSARQALIRRYAPKHRQGPAFTWQR